MKHGSCATTLYLGVLSLLMGSNALASARPIMHVHTPAAKELIVQAASASQGLVDQANQKEKRGDRKGALEDLENALRTDPRNFWGWMARAVIRLQMADYAEVIADTTRAIEINPDNPDNWSPYNLRGMAHLLKGNPAASAQDWERARQFQFPKELLHVNYYSRCAALRLAGDFNSAIAECTTSIRLLPTPEAYDNRGMAYVLAAKKQLALMDFQTAAQGFAARGDTTNLDAVIRRFLGLQAELEGVALPFPGMWDFPAVIQAARSVAPRNLEGRTFDANGLAYPSETLDSLRVGEMGAAQLQSYADIVTHAFPDAAFLRSQTQEPCADLHVDDLNTTSLANMAFVSLQAKVAANRAEAATCLQTLQKAWRQKRK